MRSWLQRHAGRLAIAGALILGAVGLLFAQTNSTGGLSTVVHPSADPCQGNVKSYLSINQTATTQVLGASGGGVSYWICAIAVVTATAQNVAIIDSATAGNACATSPAGSNGFGGSTAATGWNFAANGGIGTAMAARRWDRRRPRIGRSVWRSPGPVNSQEGSVMCRNKGLRGLGLSLALVVGVASIGGATYTQQYALATDTTFTGQVLVAMVQAAANVMGEATSTAGHFERAQFATQVLQNPTKWQPIVSMLLASQSNNPMTPLTVPSTVADSLIQTAMNAQFSNVAGYYGQIP